jgi:hypothetical protein
MDQQCFDEWINRRKGVILPGRALRAGCHEPSHTLRGCLGPIGFPSFTPARSACVGAEPRDILMRLRRGGLQDQVKAELLHGIWLSRKSFRL